MRVLLDGRAIGEEPTGVGSYALHLARELPRVGVELLLFGPNERQLRKHGLEPRPGRLEVVPELRSPMSLTGHRRLRRIAADTGCRLCHCPYLPFPFFWSGLPLVVTVHDLIPLLDRTWVAQSAKGKYSFVFRAYHRRIVQTATRIVTVSGHSAGDLTRLFPAAAGKTEVVHNGVLVQPSVADEVVAAELARLGVRPPYFLYVGRRDPYKKLGLLLEAFSSIRDRVPVQLVLVSPPDARYPEVAARLGRPDLRDRVLDLGYVPELGLRALYQRADLLVHPSIYEGFGLTLLEAMSHGTPVLACRAASVPEVVGDAAVLVEPDDQAGFADAMARLWQDSGERTRLTRLGTRRVVDFSWGRCARETAEVYSRSLTAGGRR